MATKSDKSAAAITPEMVQAVLSSLTVEDLTKAATERKAASLQPMIDEFAQTEKRLVELRKSIREVNPEWNPLTLADRILTFVKSKGKATIKEVVAEFQSDSSPFMVKNVIKKKADVLWVNKNDTLTAKQNGEESAGE